MGTRERLHGGCYRCGSKEDEILESRAVGHGVKAMSVALCSKCAESQLREWKEELASIAPALEQPLDEKS